LAKGQDFYIAPVSFHAIRELKKGLLLWRENISFCPFRFLALKGKG
jgi:hypothetical protein